MKKKFYIATLAIISTLSFTSCNSDSDVIPQSAFDIYGKKIFTIEDGVEGDEEISIAKYALYASTYTNVAINSATVLSPSADLITLSSYLGSSLTFAFEPTDADYTQTIPEGGVYYATIVPQDETIESLVNSDELTTTYPEAADVVSVELIEDYIAVTLDGTATKTDVDYFIFTLYSSDDVMVFSTDYLETSTENYNIIQDGDGWITGFSLEDAVTAKILTVKFEDSLSPDAFNIQSVTEVEMEVTVAADTE